MLTVTVEPLANTARYVKNTPIDPTNVEEICVSYLSVDAKVTLKTEDGALDETWETVIYDTENWGTPVLWPVTIPGDDTKIHHAQTLDKFKGNFYHDAGQINTDSMFNVNIDFDSSYGLRVSIFGMSLFCYDDICESIFIEGGRTNNYFAPIGLAPGEEPVLSIPADVIE